MSPLTRSDGHDAPRLIDEFVPSKAAVIDDVVVGFEDGHLQKLLAKPCMILFTRLWQEAVMKQSGLFGLSDLLGRLSSNGDRLEELGRIGDF
jgi:hypothetical protein